MCVPQASKSRETPLLLLILSRIFYFFFGWPKFTYDQSVFVLQLDSKWFLTWARSSGWHLVCSHHCCPAAVGGEVAAGGDALAGFMFVSASLEWQQEEWRNQVLCFQGSDIPLCVCDRGRKVSFGWTQGQVQIL